MMSSNPMGMGLFGGLLPRDDNQLPLKHRGLHWLPGRAAVQRASGAVLSPAHRMCYQFFQSNPYPSLVFRHWLVTVLLSVACSHGQAFRQHLAVFGGAVEEPRAEFPCGWITIPSMFWLPGLPHTSVSVSTLPTSRPFHISSDFFQILCFHSWFGWPTCTPGA